MILSHRIELDATCKQQRYFAMAAGCARFVWNLALAEWERQYAAGENPSGMKLRREFCADKYIRFPWLKKIRRDAHSQPFANLDRAYQRFFKKLAAKPVFKKKGRCRDSFYLANDQFWTRDKTLKIPRIGRVRMTEPLRFSGKIMGATIIRIADRWFVSIRVDVGEYSKPRTGNALVGVDLGLKVTATLSTGEQVQGPRALATQLAKLRRAQRKLSRRKKGSANREKAKRCVARIYARVACIRKDFLHKLTTRLCRENQTVVIEDLNVSGMQKNKRLARGISDAGFYEFKRQLLYKSEIFRTNVLTADRWYPSSKTCHGCGSVKADLSLADRLYECKTCGLAIDRDLNAALNLAALGLRVSACGRLNNPGGSNANGAESVEAGTKQRMSAS